MINHPPPSLSILHLFPSLLPFLSLFLHLAPHPTRLVLEQRSRTIEQKDILEGIRSNSVTDISTRKKKIHLFSAISHRNVCSRSTTKTHVEELNFHRRILLRPSARKADLHLKSTRNEGCSAINSIRFTISCGVSLYGSTSSPEISSISSKRITCGHLFSRNWTTEFENFREES